MLYVCSLGLLSAIHPCQLLINAGATAYLSEEMTNRTVLLGNSLFYTLGRITTYTLLAVVLYYGFTALNIQAWFEASGEKYAGVLMLLIGILMLVKHHHKHHHSHSHDCEDEHCRVHKSGRWSAFVLGFLLAFGFCVESAGIFFLLVIPLTLTHSAGLSLPVFFAVGTAIPVVLAAWLLALGVTSVDAVFARIKKAEHWLRPAVALVFVLSGLYLIVENFMGT
jgi:cytochrome c biogenesis protein CcdA